MDLRSLVKSNMDTLRRNPYPGRGIVIGQTPDGRHAVQVYWIMGRSENSRNRIFIEEGDTVRTAPFEPAKVKDPSLIIYNATRVTGRTHIVTNGDQTDTIWERLQAGGTFEQALFTRTYEPDAPNYTPRISGVVGLDDPIHAYQLSILKAAGGNPGLPLRCFYSYEKAIPGAGHMLTTYSGDGNPLPSFEGEPQLVEILNDARATLELYWTALNAENKVSLLVKFIDLTSGQAAARIVNKRG